MSAERNRFRGDRPIPGVELGRADRPVEAGDFARITSRSLATKELIPVTLLSDRPLCSLLKPLLALRLQTES
jgi:hypothetical protein